MITELTPTQREAIERSRRFRESIAMKAAELELSKLREKLEFEVRPPVKSLTPEAFPAEPDPPRERNWFEILEELPQEFPSIARIQRVICDYYGVKKAYLLSERRTADIVYPRHVAMYLAHSLAQKSLPEIGRRFGNRDHTTALHAMRKIDRMIRKDENLAFEIAQLIELITGVQQ